MLKSTFSNLKIEFKERKILICQIYEKDGSKEKHNGFKY